jgi:hypothetical protein
MRKKPAKGKRQVEQELSDEQLEAVAGGAGVGAIETPPLEGDGAETTSKASPLLAACATGKHIPKVIITTR